MSSPQQSAPEPSRLSGHKLRVIVLTLTVLLAVALTLIGNALTRVDAKTVRNAVVQGRTLLGPLKPAPKKGEQNYKPILAMVNVVEQKTGDTVASVRTSKDGRFKLRVPAGNYIVVGWLRGNDRKVHSPVPLKVTAKPGAPISLTLIFDTGIRDTSSPAP